MKTCTNCGKHHGNGVDICDKCGNMSFIPYEEGKATIGDVIKEKENKTEVEKKIVEEPKEEIKEEPKEEIKEEPKEEEKKDIKKKK